MPWPIKYKVLVLEFSFGTSSFHILKRNNKYVLHSPIFGLLLDYASVDVTINKYDIIVNPKPECVFVFVVWTRVKCGISYQPRTIDDDNAAVAHRLLIAELHFQGDCAAPPIYTGNIYVHHI